LGDGTTFRDAAAGPNGFVIVGHAGTPGFQGVVLHSTDGRAWQIVRDQDLTSWELSKVIATDGGFLAVGGAIASPVGWKSAVLTSVDGSDWTLRQTLDSIDIRAVAAHGSVVVATTDGSVLLVSRDIGRTWRQVATGEAGFGTGSPSAVAVLGSGRWLAVGTAGTSAAAWTSMDGQSWEAASIEAADPMRGIKSVTPQAIAAGSWVAVAAGTDDPQECAEGDDFCAHYGAGWTTMDGTHWTRLPRGTPLTVDWGGRVWSAGAAGVVSLNPDLTQSANGWTWTSVPGSSGDMPFGALVVRDHTVIAAGLGTGDKAPALAIWVGSIAGP
jgi:hypothetical protein